MDEISIVAAIGNTPTSLLPAESDSRFETTDRGNIVALTTAAHERAANLLSEYTRRRREIERDPDLSSQGKLNRQSALTSEFADRIRAEVSPSEYVDRARDRAARLRASIDLPASNLNLAEKLQVARAVAEAVDPLEIKATLEEAAAAGDAELVLAIVTLPNALNPLSQDDRAELRELAEAGAAPDTAAVARRIDEAIAYSANLREQTLAALSTRAGGLDPLAEIAARGADEGEDDEYASGARGSGGGDAA